MKFWPKYIACCLLLACLAACGYQLRGKGSFWPPQMKRVQVPVFKNSSGRFELDLKLTRSVINELVARTGVVIVSERSQADGLLSGEVRAFSVQPIAFSPAGTATRFKITITTSVVFSDLVNQKVLFSDENFVYTEEYDIPEGLDYETMETRAIDRAAEKYARQLVVNLVEGF
ncbi:MAG: LptE family protein [Candidatus Saccharicenans sp.]|jgi:outer membrane lipopolysaccharide assembly protein LptE/RlpB|nr:LPS assembly lipoprotein LptE [Candidatus Saccharicenans sp.]MDH7575373.1 LptE family protein [Candidatus Saccharicenans sp.]